MQISFYPGLIARLWAPVPRTAAFQRQRRGSFCLPVIDHVRYVFTRPDALPRRFRSSYVSRRDETQYPPLSVSSHCGHLCVQPGLFCSPCDPVCTCGLRVTALSPVQQLADGHCRRTGHIDIACLEKVKCNNRETNFTTTAEQLHSTLKSAECGARFRTRTGVLAQPRRLGSLLVSAQGCVTRGIADTTSLKEGARTREQGLNEYRQGKLGWVFSLKDEGGTQTLLLSPAAVQRLETLCARRRLQPSSGETANKSECLLRDERRPEEVSRMSARRPVIGLQVRVTSGGCSGYQYSFGLLTSEQVQKLRGKEEYSVFWPPSRLNSPTTSIPIEAWRTAAVQVGPSAFTTPEMKGHALPCENNTGMLRTPPGCENEGIGRRKQEKEDPETVQKNSEQISACCPGWCVFVDRCSLPLFGNKAIIDFEDTLAASEFTVQQNDRAENVCSCGRSFALKDEF